MSPAGPALSRSEREARVAELFPGRVQARAGEQAMQVARLHDLVLAGLATNRASTVWQRLRDEHGLAVSVATFRRYVRTHVRAVRPEDAAVRKHPTPQGEVAEVDYGRLGMWTVAELGILLLPDRAGQGQGLPGEPEHLAHLFGRDPHRAATRSHG